MTRYVVGFAFWRDQVLLIHKKKGPAYVVGKLNGVGGKIEEDETVIKAMAREFEEETGLETWPSLWEHVAIMFGNANEGNDYELNILYTFLPDTSELDNIKNPEPSGEDLRWVPLDDFEKRGIVENLSWLIPLCLDRTTPFLKIYEN
jgi:8-oxo-dGTP diphosphatase